MSKLRYILICFIAAMICAGLPLPVLAAGIPIELSVDKEVVELGETVQMGLTFNNVQNVPAPQLTAPDGVKIQYLGPSTMMSIVNGRVSGSVTHRYVLIAVKTGKFTLGPFSITHNRSEYVSPAKEITVVDRGQKAPPAPRAAQPDIQEDAARQLNDRIFLILSADKTRVYVNERIGIKVKLYVNQLAVRDIQFPELAQRGYIQEPFGQPRQYREQIGGVLYDVIEFETVVYPAREGTLTLGPAKTACNIVVKKQAARRRFGLDDFFSRDFFEDSIFDDFFGRFQRYPMELESVPLTLQVLPLPEPGRPREFSGAVGSFSFEAGPVPKEVKAGDPVTLNMSISGRGNFDSVTVPLLRSTENFRIYQPAVKTEDGRKIFEQVIIPQSEEITEIPELIFSYFDPEKEQYVTAKQGPFTVRVLPPEEKEAKIIDTAELSRQTPPAKTRVIGRDIVYIKEQPGPLRKQGDIPARRPVFLWLHIFPLLLLAGIAARQKRKERLHADVRYARRLRAPKIARKGLALAREHLRLSRTKEFYDAVFKTLQDYLGHRFGRPSAGITADVVDELISVEGLSGETGRQLKQCFADCDHARYAPGEFGADRMSRTLQALEEAIDYLERRRK